MSDLVFRDQVAILTSDNGIEDLVRIVRLDRRATPHADLGGSMPTAFHRAPESQARLRLRPPSEWARDRGVEAFVFRAGDGAGPDAARERDHAIVGAGPNLVIEEEPGFIARHAEERGIPVSIRPMAQLLRPRRQSPDREAGERQDPAIRKGPSTGF